MTVGNRETCPRCKMPKYIAGSGSMTEWISCCRCDVVVPSDGQLTVNLCATCGKRLGQGRVGSFTQYIFRYDLCSCNRPVPASGFQSTPRAEETKSGEDEQIEADPDLVVTPELFPQDRYQPLQLIGAGAGGRVYLCRDLLLNKDVAVKVLHFRTKEQLLNFQNEARVLSKLDHPNIVRILDFGATESGSPYMVLEHSPGISLKREIEIRKRLDPQSVKYIFVELAHALSYCHERDVMHRDLKPENILFATRHNEPAVIKLIDFGIAMIADQGNLTEEELLAGTPAYMSPDQVLGRKYDTRSEIYSFGCVLFETLTGRPPFIGETALDVLNKHAYEDAPGVEDFTPESIPEQLVEIIETCLRKKPDDRYQTMHAVADALMAVALEEQTAPIEKIEEAPIQPFRAEKSKFTGVVILSCLVSLTVLGGVYFLTGHKEPATTSKKSKSAKKSKFAKPTYKIERYQDIGSYNIAGDVTKEALRDLVLNYHPREIFLDSYVSDIDWKALPELNNCENLKVLNIHGAQFNDKQCPLLLGLTQLDKLSVTETAVTDEGVKTISALHNLRRLVLSSSQATGKCIPYLAKMPNLSSLDMEDLDNIEEADLELFKTFPKLVMLDVSSDPIGDRGLQVISALHLTKIGIDDTGITDDGLKVLANKKNIEKLCIVDNLKITDKSIPTILTLQNLKMLKIGSKTRISKAGVAKIHAANPNIEVKWDTGVGIAADLADKTGDNNIETRVRNGLPDVQELDPSFFSKDD